VHRNYFGKKARCGHVGIWKPWKDRVGIFGNMFSNAMSCDSRPGSYVDIYRVGNGAHRDGKLESVLNEYYQDIKAKKEPAVEQLAS
jgi:hypothetical protein